ncbi:TPA: recombination-associated protein RdgC [Enterobacter hormaechei subsp. xiangfangensis]|nr:recombination-associated protein RdgC [Enterobacter hormaechei subsp. xiangfangensis]HAV1890649.1 recombination-associated protein RdgC [Enterobacter hormaechei subsp. xiangfangensis]
MFKLFKNASIYRLTRDLPNLTVSGLAQAMPDVPFVHCTQQESARTGWVMNDDNTPWMLHHKNQILITLRTERRDVPKDVINAELQKRVDAWEQKMGTLPRRPEKSLLRDEVFQALLPRAFAKSSYMQILIDTGRKLVIVDTASARQAENALALLRRTLHSLPVYPVASAEPPEIVMTNWMRGPVEALPTAIMPEDGRLVLENTLEPSMKATFNGFGRCEAAQELMNTSNVITSLSLSLMTQHKLSLLLTSNLQLKRLVWSDLMKEQATADGEDAAGEDDDAVRELVEKATFILMADELGQAWDLIIDALGGEAEWHNLQPEQEQPEAVNE